MKVNRHFNKVRIPSFSVIEKPEVLLKQLSLKRIKDKNLKPYESKAQSKITGLFGKELPGASRNEKHSP